METTYTPRNARMEFKTTPDTKELLAQAAALNGTDLTAFVLGSAIEKAREVLTQHASISLSRKGQLVLVSSIKQEAKPTKAIKELMRLDDLPSRNA